ncbi:hypothetical protein CALVIDRAFT_567813 [Calocera viscosa TUFC12733]|uniref:Uncharacterized protein n=1 Tax=Calocera viscosa (strain TUFC12733) TaxID=1330018 RepID=A0A167HS37_CALVF|nr:hypothetical protein CALVIDRAFT_567813 [Calocera viscosa TUFC12733]
MSFPTIAFALLAFAARGVFAADDDEVEAATGGAQAVMNATAPATGSGSTVAVVHKTLFDNAVPYCSFTGGKIQCDPLTTHQKLFVILGSCTLALILLLLITFCCCCCCSRRRNGRKAGPPSIYVSSSSSSLEAPQSAQGPYYGAYGGQPPYGSRLNDQRPQAGSASGGTNGKDTEKRQAVYGREYSRT